MAHDPSRCGCEDCGDWRYASELTAEAYGGYHAIKEQRAESRAEKVRYRVYLLLREGYRITFKQVQEMMCSMFDA